MYLKSTYYKNLQYGLKLGNISYNLHMYIAAYCSNTTAIGLIPKMCLISHTILIYYLNVEKTL